MVTSALSVHPNARSQLFVHLDAIRPSQGEGPHARQPPGVPKTCPARRRKGASRDSGRRLVSPALTRRGPEPCLERAVTYFASSASSPASISVLISAWSKSKAVSAAAAAAPSWAIAS